MGRRGRRMAGVLDSYLGHRAIIVSGNLGRDEIAGIQSRGGELIGGCYHPPYALVRFGFGLELVACTLVCRKLNQAVFYGPGRDLCASLHDGQGGRGTKAAPLAFT